jgi:antitoxin component YwqK of YwqJK toxin-antitoxin module
MSLVENFHHNSVEGSHNFVEGLGGNAISPSISPPDGHFITYHDNGHIKEKGTYNNGMLQGVFQEYDEDGKLVIQSHWKDDALNGKLTHWRDVVTGLLYETTLYLNDLKVVSSKFDSFSRISGNYYYNSHGKCSKSVEYKRLTTGGTIVATTVPGYYYEEFIASN